MEPIAATGLLQFVGSVQEISGLANLLLAHGHFIDDAA